MPLAVSPLNDVATQSQTIIEAIALTGGGHAVLWIDHADFNTHITVYGADGSPVTRDALVTTSEFDRFSMTALAGGGFVVAHETYRDATSEHVAFEIFDADGVRIHVGTTSSTPPDSGFNPHLYPEVVGLETGDFAIVWSDRDGAVPVKYPNPQTGALEERPYVLTTVHVQFFSVDGEPLSAPINVGAIRSDAIQPHITALDGDRAVLHWDAVIVPEVHSQPWERANYLQIVSPGGPITSIRVIADSESSVQVLALAGGARFVVLWGASGGNLQYQVYESSGASIGGAHDAGIPSAVPPYLEDELIGLALPDGGFALFGGSLSVRIFDANGSPTNATQIAGGAFFEEAAVTGTGAIVIAWKLSSGGLTDEWFVSALDNDGSLLGTAAIPNPGFAAELIASGPAALVFWSEANGLGAFIGTPFTGGADEVNFNQQADLYLPGAQYQALAGDDVVVLPRTAEIANAQGYDLSEAFLAGVGNDAITGSDLGDVIHGDEGSDELYGGKGRDELFGDAGDDDIDAGDGDDVVHGVERFGDDGNNVLDGGLGDADTVKYEGPIDSYTLSLETYELYFSGISVNTGFPTGPMEVTAISGASDSVTRFDLLEFAGNIYTANAINAIVAGNWALSTFQDVLDAVVTFGEIIDELPPQVRPLLTSFERIIAFAQDVSAAPASPDLTAACRTIFVSSGILVHDLVIDELEAALPPPISLALTLSPDYQNLREVERLAAKDAFGNLYDAIQESLTPHALTLGETFGDWVHGYEESLEPHLDGVTIEERESSELEDLSTIPVLSPLSLDDIRTGTPGNDDINHEGDQDAYDIVIAGAGDDAVIGGNGNDWLFGGAGNDAITGNGGNDNVFGEGGDDQIVAATGAGDDLYDGGIGDDTIVFSSAALGVMVDLEAGIAGGAEIDTDALAGIENVVGSPGNDFIAGDRHENRIAGAGGDDRLFGREGADALFGGEGLDLLSSGSGADTANGGGGADIFAGTAAELDGDTIEDLTPQDRIRIQGSISTTAQLQLTTASSSLLVDLEGDGTVDATILVPGVENARLISQANEDGNPYVDFRIVVDDPPSQALEPLFTSRPDIRDLNDVSGFDLTSRAYMVEPGPNGPDELMALSGGDRVILPDTANAAYRTGTLFDSGSGSDTVLGGDLADLIEGGSGADEISGGAGDDTLNGGSGRDAIEGGSGDDRLDGGSGRDRIDGGDGADRLYGDSGADTLTGGSGDDTLFGGSGADVLTGESGDDTLFGGSGADVLTGGLGADVLSGGSGRDRFEYANPDQGGDMIMDFAVGRSGDMLDLTDLFSDVALTDIDQHLALTIAGNDTIIVIDAACGGNFQDLVTLCGVSTSLEKLLADGNIVIDGATSS